MQARKTLAAVCLCALCATGATQALEVDALAAAFPASKRADDATLIAELEARLPASLSVASQGHLVIAVPASGLDSGAQRQRIARVEDRMRQQAFPGLEAQRIVVVLAPDASALQDLAGRLYPQLPASGVPASGLYHPQDRLILASTAQGYGDLWAQLMRALLRDDNPKSPHWFEEAAATLYASSEWQGNRLTPTLDGRMRDIPVDQDLDYDVFAGVCDCYPLTAEQLALMRLLLIYLQQRGELHLLHAAIKEQGRYTTLLQALDTMEFDRHAWKAFAEDSVRSYPH